VSPLGDAQVHDRSVWREAPPALGCSRRGSSVRVRVRLARGRRLRPGLDQEQGTV